MRHGVRHTSVRVVGLLMGWASFVTASATGVAASICAASRHFFLHHRATRCAPRSILCASMQPKPPATADCIRALQCSPFAVTFSFVCASELSYRKRFVLANVKISRGASGQSCASDRPIIDNHEHDAHETSVADRYALRRYADGLACRRRDVHARLEGLL